jgi:hypothetical protein
VQILQFVVRQDRHLAFDTIVDAVVSIGDGYVPGLHWVHVRIFWVTEATKYD